jgi:uncharacterized protein YqgC (DUF456 family)
VRQKGRPLQPWLETSIFGITQFFMLVGLLGLIVPIYPGTVIMWLAALGYGWISGFSPTGIAIFVILTLLMLASTLVDNLMMGMGARKGGASWKTIAIALLAGILGTIIFPPFGGIIAAPLAVFGLEYIRLGNVGQAWAALRGLATGWGLSFVVRFGIGFIMMLLWWLWVWKG